MVTRDEPWPHGTPCWIDLGVDDVGAARLFYEGLFGWQITEGPPEAGGYLMCLKEGRPAAGLGPKMSVEQPSMWSTYLAVSDADETLAKVIENGGQVLLAAMDVMEFGRMGIAADPAGAVFGVWQARSMPGVGIANAPGAFIWSENMSRDWQANKAFYAAVIGFEYNDMSGDGFDYATLRVNGADVGGIGSISADSPDDTPASWVTYFAVDDADESVDRVVKLGGAVIRAPWDTPFGRMAIVSDVAGATFSLMSTPAEGYDAATDSATDEASTSG